MNKKTKIAAIISAGALLTIGSSLAAFAATTGWVQEGGSWRYYDSSGDYVTETWKKSGDNYFWLDEDGYMATDCLIDDDGDYYAVDVNGAMMKNQWYYSTEDDEDAWFYFTSTGKAKEDGWLTIDGNRYHFTDSEMDYGWYEDDNNEYYLGTIDTGYATVGWLEYDGMDDDSDKDEGWYYFESTGKMVKGKEKKIGNYYYSFDDEGLMLDNWVSYTTASSSTASATSYGKYYKEEYGDRASGWKYLYDIDDDDDSDLATEEGWYYFKSGKPYTSEYKTTKIDDNIGFAKINSKTYAFDEDGKMYDGTVETSDGRIFYFGEEDDGAMKTGKVKVKNSDEYEGETMYFAKSGSMGEKGAAVTGVEDGYLYDGGVLVEADDNYEIVEVGGLTYLVKESGKIVKSGTVKDSDNEIKYTVTKNDDGGYTIVAENY